MIFEADEWLAEIYIFLHLFYLKIHSIVKQ